jgi:16S rRNA (guanine966-N2)-methyltransferase
MRIIAGEWRGRSIDGGEGLRPTSDFVRQALFSILGGTIGGTFLDLYAGSGAVGLEARSRGASVVLVEREPLAVATIRGNLERLDVRGGIAVVPGDVLRFLKHPEESRIDAEPFDVVFADPPYDYPLQDKLLRVLAGSALVGPSTLVVVERRIRTRVKQAEGLATIRETTHGEVTLTQYRRGAATDEAGAPDAT